MKPQRFWAVTEHGEVYANSIYDDRATAVENAKCPDGYRNCRVCRLQVVRVEVSVVKPAAEPSSNLPPLPIDEGRVRDDLADFRDWMIDNMRFVECLRIGSEHHPLGGAIQVTDYYIAEINKRLSALAGKEKP